MLRTKNSSHTFCQCCRFRSFLYRHTPMVIFLHSLHLTELWFLFRSHPNHFTNLRTKVSSTLFYLFFLFFFRRLPKIVCLFVGHHRILTHYVFLSKWGVGWSKKLDFFEKLSRATFVWRYLHRRWHTWKNAPKNKPNHQRRKSFTYPFYVGNDEDVDHHHLQH